MRLDYEKNRCFYNELPVKINNLKNTINRPLTLTEKILFSHADDFEKNEYTLDHVALHDTSAQLALLQFALSNRKNPETSTSVHCDHLICAQTGEREDLEDATKENQEIYKFLQSACTKYAMDFWLPGSGILHQQILNHYAIPGGLLLGTDPYVSYAGGLSMLALEKGSGEALDAMIGLKCDIPKPRVIGVHLSGELQGWASPKDVILKLIPILASKGAKGAFIEFFGPGAETISCHGKGTICSMVSEAEAIAGIFSYDSKMAEFLVKMNRDEVADLANQAILHLQADQEVQENPSLYYEQMIYLDLSSLVPHINGPSSTHRSVALSDLSNLVQNHGYPENLSAALLGSCVNSSYEDLEKAALLARKAIKHGLKLKIPLYITPGSELIRSALIDNGLWKIFEELGATLLASACGPCIGQWKRNDVAFGERNSIITSYNCIAPGLNDANPNTFTFIASPEVVMAFAFTGNLKQNPLNEAIINPHGLPVKLVPSNEGQLNFRGFRDYITSSLLPPHDPNQIQIEIDPTSEKLQLLEPFKGPMERAFADLRLLIKVGGKCTTDHISPASKWLKYRGHLDNMSNNLFSLAPNRFREEVGKGKNLLTGNIESFSKVARDYKKEGIGWIMVASDQCGEGPYREYAALGLRHLGGKVVIAHSYASSFENYLKKQGVLALTFAWPADSEKIREDDLIDLLGVGQLAVGSSLELLLKHADGTTDRLPLSHSYTEDELLWFKAGGVINALSLQAN